MSDEQKRLLEQQLWNIANELRGKMDADEFRDYILGFIFYKYLSEKQYLYANSLLETEAIKDYRKVANKEDLEAIKEESLIKLGYFLKPNELFSAIAKKGNANTETESDFILQDLEAILNGIEQSTMGTESEDDFNKLFEDLDLNSTKLGRTVEARNSLIAKVLVHLDKIDFDLENVESDVLGDAYEYLIAQFASGAGKKAGEFYTPQQVSKILAKVVTTGKKRLKSVYDPTCGSGSLLLRVAREVKVDEFFGQELNRTTYNLARMNMILHDVHYRHFDLRQDDTLEHPQHLDMRFEAIVANPPFSAKWKGDKNPLNENDERFSQYGRIAPSSKADFAFVKHMIYQLADNGTMACILPHGVLFRGAAEETIRKHLINKLNYLDAVIGLPSNIFYGTSIPTCILIISKCRVHDDNILFIDASQGYEKAGNQNNLREEDIDKIISTYRDRIPILKYSHVASLAEIKENGYNLNIPLYVDTFEEELDVDLINVSEKFKELIIISEKNDKKIFDFCGKLNLPTPLGHNVHLLEQFKKGVIQKLLSQEIRFKDDDGKNYPNWELKKLGEIAQKSSSNISANKIENNIGEYKIYGASGLLKFVDFYKEEVEYISIVKDGAGVGRILLCDAFSSVLGTLDIIKAKSGTNLYFIYYLLSKINFKKYITGSTIPHIYFKDYSKEKIKIPCIAEQTKIANFLVSIDVKIELVSGQIDKTEKLKKSLLQQITSK